MTKALHCSQCNSVHTFKPDGTLTTCDCSKVQGWWIDAHNGIAALYTPNPDDRQFGHILSLHNGFLNDGPTMIPQAYYDPLTQRHIPYPVDQANTFWRHLHQQAGITPRAPETVRVWDTSLRGCWAVILEPGTTADTGWATDADAKVKGSGPKRELIHGR